MFGAFFSKPKLIVTHDGKFHTDDIFACAMVTLLPEVAQSKYTIIRSRDEKIIQTGDYVVDVSGAHNPAEQRFDHHQPGGAGVRENGIPYAAAGLVWKTYGAVLAGSVEVASLIDATLIQCIDADDNGYSLIELKHGIRPYRLQETLYAFRPTWKEEQDFDSAFLKLVSLARDILSREIRHAQDGLLATKEVHGAYTRAKDKRIVELATNFPFQATLSALPEPLYVINPRPNNGGWKVEAVAKNANTFELRKPLPEMWAGLRSEALAQVSGVPDAIFCHNGRFMAVAKTREGALLLAQKAAEA